MKPFERPSAMTTLIEPGRLRAALRGSRGRGVRVALLDSGVDGKHPRLAGRIAAQYDVQDGRGGPRCVPAPAADSIGHGTACAGIIAEIAPEAEITSIRVFGAEARGSAEQLAAALTFAIDGGFPVINMSLGTTNPQAALRLGPLADRAFYEGRIIVAAANNHGQAAFPAQLSSVLSVGMEDFSDAGTIRYSFGDPIELGARGIYVEAPAPGGGLQLCTGTSFACPHVSGLVARLVACFPTLCAFEARTLLTLLARAGEPA